MGSLAQFLHSLGNNEAARGFSLLLGRGGGPSGGEVRVQAGGEPVFPAPWAPSLPVYHPQVVEATAPTF